MSRLHHRQCSAELLLGAHADTEACTHSLLRSSTDLPALAMLALTDNDAVLQEGALPAV